MTKLPLDPTVNADPKTLPDDERMILNLVFLKYANSAEISKLILPYLGEGGQISTYDPANLLLIEDNSRSMKRTMELVSMFDSDAFAGQRVKLFEVTNSRPSDMVKDLDSIFKAYALSEKAAAVRFIPVDRVNEIIAVASNPGIFDQVKTWIDKLDVTVKAPAGAIELYAYRLKYGRAEVVAMAIMAVLTGNPMAMVGLAAASGGGIASGASGYGMGMGMGEDMEEDTAAATEGATEGDTAPTRAVTGAAMATELWRRRGLWRRGLWRRVLEESPYAAGMDVSRPARRHDDGRKCQPGSRNQAEQRSERLLSRASRPWDSRATPGVPASYPILSTTPSWCAARRRSGRRFRTCCTRSTYPRARCSSTPRFTSWISAGAYSAGLQAYLQKATGATGSTRCTAAGGTITQGLGVCEGWMVGHALQLLGPLNLAETNNNAKVIAAPSIIATDSVPAVMNFGQSIPILTSQAVVGGVQSGGTNVFANTISQQSTGTTLSITARINSSGVVTMMIDQNVSSPVTGVSASSISSPSFNTRSFSTQLTVQDGDTVAIGGFIQEQDTTNTTGIPIIDRIPGLGALFSGKVISKARTELIVFLTPRVIYDTNQLVDATEEIKSNLKKLQKVMAEQ